MLFVDKLYFHTHDEEENIVINGINGAVDIIEKSVVEILKRRDSASLGSLDNEIVNALYERGYIFKTEKEKNELLESVQNVYQESIDRKPIKFTISPTMDCNLNCSYCFEGLDKRHLIMSDEMLNAVFQSITKILEGKRVGGSIELFGGEPLMKSNYTAIEKIFRFAEESYLRGISIITNGVELEHYITLLEKYRRMISAISITLDGPEKIHEEKRVSKDGSPTFNQIISNIENCLDKRLPVTVRINVDQNNFKYVHDLLELLDKKFSLYDNFSCYLALITHNLNEGENSITISQLAIAVDEFMKKYEFLDSSGLDVLQHLVRVFNGEKGVLLPRFHYCDATSGKHYSYCPDGLIYTCEDVLGLQEYSIGEFYPKHYINHDALNLWTKETIRNRNSCKDCDISLLCGGGCPIKNKKEHKNHPDGCSCTHNKYEIKAYLDYISSVS